MGQAMKGKTVIVTGANSGIGKETAVRLATMGASTVLICRNEAKGREAAREVAERSGNADVELLVADLLLQREVRGVAQGFLSTHGRLEVLVNNAGTVFTSYAETDEGVERTMAVNYFAPFLLTGLLVECLKRGSPSRVVNVSSSAHYSGSIDLSKLTSDRRMGLGGLGAYGRSKLALVLFTYELARRLDGSGVTANCLHPGAVRTNIWARAGPFSPLTRLAAAFMKSPSKGAETSVFLASSSEVEGVTGGYFEGCRPKRSLSSSYDLALANGLWEASEETTGLANRPGPSTELR